MKTSKSIEVLYQIINKHMGPQEAKNFVSEILFNVISELQEENTAVTEEEIEKKLSKKAEDYLHASKSKEVA